MSHFIKQVVATIIFMPSLIIMGLLTLIVFVCEHIAIGAYNIYKWYSGHSLGWADRYWNFVGLKHRDDCDCHDKAGE